MTARDELRSALETIAAAVGERADLRKRDYAYASRYDFVLQEGTWYDAPTEPHGYPQGAPRMCFGNAIDAAVLHGLRYVEGYAASAVVPDMPIHHAWNLDPDGQLVDVTWGAWDGTGRCVVPVGAAYLGVEFSVERADEATWDGDASVLDDFRRDWPLFRVPWRGEPDGEEWEPSPRLEALRAYRDGDLETAYRLYADLEQELAL